MDLYGLGVLMYTIGQVYMCVRICVCVWAQSFHSDSHVYDFTVCYLEMYCVLFKDSMLVKEVCGREWGVEHFHIDSSSLMFDFHLFP